MKIKNPTSSNIEVLINGTEYKLPADGELLGVNEDVAKYWKDNLHNFLILENENKVEVKLEVDKIISKAKKVIE